MSEDTYNEIACSYARAQTAHFANRLAKEQPKRLLPGSSGLLDFLNPDKEWDADTLDAVRQVLDRHRLCPARLMTPGEVYRKPTPNENWKDDSVQFPRLLDELQGIGVVNIISEAEWECLAAEMDLPSEKIMQIFARAQKEWDRIKKETKWSPVKSPDS